MSDQIVDAPNTPEALLADDRFWSKTWRAPDGKTFYQFLESRWGADRTAHLWWDAICVNLAGREAA